LKFSKDENFVNNVCSLVIKCIDSSPKTHDEFIDLLKTLMSKDTKEGFPSPQRKTINCLISQILNSNCIYSTNLIANISKHLIQDESYLKSYLNLMIYQMNISDFIKFIYSLKLKTLSDHFIVYTAFELIPMMTKFMSNDELMKLIKEENEEIIKFILRYFIKNPQNEFLVTKEGIDYLESLKKHKNGEISYLAFNFIK